MSMENEIDEIENYLDKSWNEIRITKLPLNIALLGVLVLAQNIFRSRLSSPQMIRLRQAMEILIPHIFEKCKKEGDQFDITNTIGITVEELDIISAEAIVFAQIYEWFSYHITDYRQGHSRCDVAGRNITFSDKSKKRLIRSLSEHDLQIYHETHGTDQKEISKLSLTSPPQALSNYYAFAFKRISADRIFSTIPSRVYSVFKKMVESSSFKPTIDTEAIFDEYSVGEYYSFWTSLSALVISYDFACRIKFGSLSQDKNRGVLVTTTRQIAEMVNYFEGLGIDKTSKILRELIYDPNNKQQDFQVKPIIELDNTLLIVPYLIFTGNWEVCLLRNWAKKSTSRYGDVIASKKDRLANELSKYLDQGKIEKVVRKKLYYDGKPLGDVDVGIFDKETGVLFIIEVKWVITPDSYKEESNAKEELSKGVRQLKNIIQLYQRDPSYIIRELFPNLILKSDEIRDIKLLLVCRGSINTGIEDEEQEIIVLDYDILVNSLNVKEHSSLTERVNNAINIHEAIYEKVQKELKYDESKIAGYLLRTEGLSQKMRTGKEFKQNEQKFGTYGNCFCGSGKPYDDCCKALENN